MGLILNKDHAALGSALSGVSTSLAVVQAHAPQTINCGYPIPADTHRCGGSPRRTLQRRWAAMIASPSRPDNTRLRFCETRLGTYSALSPRGRQRDRRRETRSSAHPDFPRTDLSSFRVYRRRQAGGYDPPNETAIGHCSDAARIHRMLQIDPKRLFTRHLRKR